jgi:hypothetical protein
MGGARSDTTIVIPAEAGTSGRPAETSRPGVPAFAGMTGGGGLRSLHRRPS